MQVLGIGVLEIILVALVAVVFLMPAEIERSLSRLSAAVRDRLGGRR